jgi:hypothetical protein
VRGERLPDLKCFEQRLHLELMRLGPVATLTVLADARLPKWKGVDNRGDVVGAGSDVEGEKARSGAVVIIRWLADARLHQGEHRQNASSVERTHLDRQTEGRWSGLDRTWATRRRVRWCWWGRWSGRSIRGKKDVTVRESLQALARGSGGCSFSRQAGKAVRSLAVPEAQHTIRGSFRPTHAGY